MGMIKCTECGKEMSDRAAVCPNCGCPIEDIRAKLGAVKQYKVNKCFLDLINKLKADGIEEIYTDCAYYSNTSAAEAI